MAAEPPPARPALLPRGRRRRLSLCLLIAFVFLKGLVWSVTVPSFWGSDEDYHFLYIESLTTQGQLPSPDRPLYPPEYGAVAEITLYDSFGSGPRRKFAGDPKRSVRELAKLPDSARDPTLRGRGVGVVHPPGYHLPGAAVNAALGEASVLTRVTVVRFLSAAFAALAVLFAWVLAAQVLTRFRHQMLAAFLVAVQPILSYLSGIVNHDTALVAFSTAALAMMLFIVRTPPRARQGAWLAAALVPALLVKGSALALLPLAGLALLLQGLVHRARWREVARSGALAALLVVLLAGWWYVRSKIVYGSLTGATTAYTDAGGGGGEGLFTIEILSWAREWIALTYRTYWWHYIFFEAPGTKTWWFYLPMGVGGLGVVGLVLAAWGERRRLLSEESPLLRQIVLCVAAAIAIMLPFIGVDLLRRSGGEGFFANGGRYLMPAYPAVATLFVVGLCRLFRGRARTPAMLAAAALATLLNLRVYDFHWLNRYFGHADVGELLRRLSFDRPEFVTPATIATCAVLAAVALAGSFVIVARDREPAD
jgi:hypothetical protein